MTMPSPQIGDTRIQVNPKGSIWRYSIQIYRKWGPWEMFPPAWCYVSGADISTDATDTAELLHRMHTTYFTGASK